MTTEAGKQNGDGGGKPPVTDVVAKADFEAKVAESAKLKQDLEDMRMEIYSPDYLAFLEAKEKGSAKSGNDNPPPKEDDLSKLTPAQLLARAKEEAKKELQQDIDKAKKEAVETVGKDTAAKEVASFARTHGDYEQWRPVMYGLSLDPKNKELSLQELYDKAKDHVKRLGEPSAEEKERQRKLATEKPGGSHESYIKYKKMSADEIAQESFSEVKEKFGGLPPAV